MPVVWAGLFWKSWSSLRLLVTNSLIFFSSRHQWQTWRSSLCLEVDVSTGGEADACPPHRLEVPLHGLSSLSIHPSSSGFAPLCTDWHYRPPGDVLPSRIDLLLNSKFKSSLRPDSRGAVHVPLSSADQMIWNLHHLNLSEHLSSVWFVLCENKVDLLIEL